MENKKINILTDEKKQNFVPHLECYGENYGEIGHPTKYKDTLGRELFVGDIVAIYKPDGTFCSLEFVVETSALTINGYKQKQFVMSIEQDCDDETWQINNGWHVLKAHSFDCNLPICKIGDVECIREENKETY